MCAERVTLFLCGDVMTGRGVDQILPHPSSPQLYEPFVKSAIEYVELAEAANGRIDKPVSYEYIWGDALAELARVRPDARIVNLETAVTASAHAWPGKGIHYRMNPLNVPCLTVAAPDCCVLANNHVLDWGREGLAETLRVLHASGLRTVGAGLNRNEACAPARVPLRGGDALVFACATANSGVGATWRATDREPGVCELEDVSPGGAERLAARVLVHRRARELVVLSVHWGGNWGYEVSDRQRAFAHRLIDSAAVDLVHGHSSHHPRPMEVYRNKLILYGCGDFLNDYEGIAGYERYRGELGLMYFPTLDAVSGELLSLSMTPTRLERLRVNRADRSDAQWLCEVLNRECGRFGVTLKQTGGGLLELAG